MIYIKDEVEKMVPSAEEKEMKEEEIEEKEMKKEEIEEKEMKEEEIEEKAEEEKGEDDAGILEHGADEEQESGHGEGEEKKEALPPATVKMEKNIKLCVDPSEKKQSDGLNLNNEVVRMRKEVKRVRALIIRKLTRQIGALKKKKGKETEIERNQRRASRLLEEIHVMKGLSPDLVTKTALQKSLNFEQECKNPNSTISDRAIARIATHPQFNKKIEDIKAAVKAFKEERMKGGKQVGTEKMQNKAGKVTLQSPAKNPITAVEKKIDSEEEDDMFTETAGANFMEPEKEKGKAVNSNVTLVCQSKEKPEPEKVRPTPLKSSKVEKKPNLKSLPEVLQKKKDEEESDLELSDEEKEYFDDSTEERFRKQSSQSESDDDDFFVGKVSKFKKKKLKNTQGEKGHEVQIEQTDEVQSKPKELESRQKSKATSLQSVFCTSLAASKPGGGSGAGRGRGGDKFRGQGRPWGSGGQKRDFRRQSKFQKEEKGTERPSGSTYSKSDSSEKPFPSDSRGKGRGREAVTRKRDHRHGGVFSSQAPQQALHPSWEASKKRKEQQGQIMAFQGKKIKFDDDD